MHAPPQSATRPDDRGALSRGLGSFAAIGAVGFAIEAVLLTLLTRYVGWSPWQARLPSFVTAVLVTWALNRRHTFAGRGLQQRSLEALAYAGIQVGGALVNLGIFGVCLHFLPQLHELAVVALAIGAGGGFAFNFVVSNAVLYSRARTTPAGES